LTPTARRERISATTTTHKPMTATPDERLASTSTSTGCGLRYLAVAGGSILFTADELRPVLEQAYDPSIPPAMTTDCRTELKRPECFNFALDFLGDPEAPQLLRYIEALEARVALGQPRRLQLFALAAQLHELTTEEEREDYPFWDHLNDLINDLEIEED